MLDIEIEAKFSVAHPDLFARYLFGTEIGEYRMGKCREVYVVDDYMDTCQRDIVASGFILRVRDRDGERFITVKSYESQHPRLSVREQIEFPIGSEIGIEHWGNETARVLISPLVGSRKLQTTVQLRQTRGERKIYSEDLAVALLSMDHVKVYLNGAHLDQFYVLEVELLQDGEYQTLEQICSHVQAEGLMPQSETKLERAFAAVASHAV